MRHRQWENGEPREWRVYHTEVILEGLFMIALGIFWVTVIIGVVASLLHSGGAL